MKLYINGTETELDIDDSSYRYRAIMGENSLTLTFSKEGFVEIPVGSYANFMGERYTLTRPQNFRKNNTRNFEYTLILDGAQKQLDKYKYRNTNDGSLKFSLTAKPEEHLQMLVANLNQRDSGWTVGNFTDAAEKTIAYNHSYCSDALRMMAEAFSTEWEVVGKTIHLRRVEYNKTEPLALSYGKGNGFKSGVSRSNVDNSRPAEILYVQGGSQNIDASKYGSRELLLPKSQQYTYEGRQYTTDAAGLSIRRADKTLVTMEEDSLDLSNIYPNRVGTINSVSVVDEKKNFYDFTDSSIPEALNFAECVTGGETMTVIFQTGMLAGREFEVKYTHQNRNFAITPQEVDGQTMPNGIFKPAASDKYAVFGIQLPDAYICDNNTQTGASWELFKQAAKYLYENEDPRFSFTGELDGIWAKTQWNTISGKIRLGGYIAFTDAQFQEDPVLIRIVGVKELINNPYKPQIELSNVTVGQTIAGSLAKIETNEVVTAQQHESAIQYAKRRYRDAAETIEMLQGAMENFTGGINPVTVNTMAMLVGDESLQFKFIEGGEITYNPEVQTINAAAGTIQHMTLGIKDISSSHKETEYHFWDLPEFTSEALGDLSVDYDPAHTELTQGKRYYLYASCAKDIEDRTAHYFLSESTLPMDGGENYNLLIAAINSDYENNRNIVPLYGFTEVLPGRITTDRVVSSDGQNFIDFVNNAFRIGNELSSLEFNKDQNGELIIKGTLVQSQSGDTAPMGVWRGDYNPLAVYYPGDEFAYNGSTFLTVAQAAPGTSPTNATFFKVRAAKGEDGENGLNGQNGENGVSMIFKGELATPPANPQNGWTYKNTSTKRSYVYQDGAWYQMTVDGLDGSNGLDGINGKDGNNGLSIVYKGELSAAPSNPQTNWTYKDANNGIVYIFNGTAWQVMVADGSDGTNGANGTNGLSVFITYNDNVATLTPSTPTGDGTTGGWHTTPSNTCVWMSQKVAASATAGTWGAPMRIKGTDGINGLNGTNGTNGATGDFYEYQYAKNGSKTAPPTLSTTSLNPTGWSTALPIITTLEYCWMTVAKKNGTGTTLLANWSTPVRVSAIDGINGTNGTNGTNGATGDYYESRYFKNNTPSTPPNAPASFVADPAGWTIAPPAISATEYLWVSVCKKDGTGTIVKVDWSSPVRSTGMKGADGINGTNGAIGASAVYRGVYDPAKTYYGNTARVDIVQYGGAYYVARTDAGTFSGVLPTDAAKWNSFGSQFDSVATSLLFADMAYVDNLAVRYLQTAPDGARITMDGSTIHFYSSNNVEVARIENGTFYGYGAVLQNAMFTSSNPINSNKVEINDGSLHLVNDYGSSIYGYPWGLILTRAGITMTGGEMIQLKPGCEIWFKDSQENIASLLAQTYLKTDSVRLRKLTQTEIDALPIYSIYVDTNGRHAAKDGNGTPHVLW